jgi:hypothetical protein
MKKNLGAGLITLLTLAGCSKDKKDHYCSAALAGDYHAVVTDYTGGPSDDEMPIRVSGNPANRDQVIFSDISENPSDDVIHANINCGATTLTFTKEGELTGLASGTGSFDTVAGKIKFRLITLPGSGTELDTQDYVLTRL